MAESPKCISKLVELVRARAVVEGIPEKVLRELAAVQLRPTPLRMRTATLSALQPTYFRAWRAASGLWHPTLTNS